MNTTTATGHLKSARVNIEHVLGYMDENHPAHKELKAAIQAIDRGMFHVNDKGMSLD